MLGYVIVDIIVLYRIWGLRITKESKRFSNALPENYELKPKAEMRILVLKYKDDPKPLNFNIKFANGTVHNIKF